MKKGILSWTDTDIYHKLSEKCFKKSVWTEGVVKCEALNFEANSALILTQI